MQMLSTRGAAAVSPAEAILRGLAPDGGLYAPAQFPAFSREDVLALVPMSYQERAFAVLSRFLPDFGAQELRAAARADALSRGQPYPVLQHIFLSFAKLGFSISCSTSQALPRPQH